MDKTALILLVDDDAQMLCVMSRLLSRTGYHVTEATTGQDGLRLARERAPDLILLDDIMPDLDSIELCQRIKAEPELANTFLVFISGHKTSSDTQAEGLEAGADGYIVRPISNRELLARVHAFLRIKRAEDAVRERTHALGERIKELNCFYGISALVEQPGIPLPEILQGIVHLLPPAWQYPDIAGARIVLDGHEYRTENFQQTVWMQERDIFVGSEREGVVQVCYLEERPDGDEGPFLNEERRLLNAIAERLGRIIERLRAQEGQRAALAEALKATKALRESELRYRALFESAPVGIGLATAKGKILAANETMIHMTGYSESELVQINVRDTYHDSEERTLVLEKLQRYGDVRGLEVRLERKDGTPYFASLNVSPLKLAGEDILLTVVEDVTERVRAQEALKRSEERYALAQRAANIGSWDWSIHTNDLHWSDQIEPMFGFGRGKFPGTYEAFLECIHPEDRQKVIDAVAACVERGDDYAIEHRIVWPDGAVRWMSETGDVITGESGEAIRMLGVVRDITAHKHADEQLRRLSRVVEQSPSIVVITDTAGKIEYVNPEFTETTGYSAADVLGQKPRLLKSGQHSPTYYRDLWRTILAGWEWRGELVNRRKNGEHYWELASISPIRNAAGTITHFAKLAQDITERKKAREALQESEERYRDLVENLSDVIYSVDGDGRITYISPAVEFFMGYRPSEVVGHQFAEFIYPEDLDRVQANFRDILSGHLVEPSEYRIVTKAGGIRWMRTSSRPIIVENRFLGVQGVLADITERVTAEQALQDAKEVAEATRREEVERRLEAEQRRRIAESLADVLSVLNSNQDLDKVLDYIALQARQLLENQAVAIFNLQGETETFSIQAAQGLPIGYVAGADIPIGHGALNKAVRLREPVTVPDVVVDLFDDGELTQDAYHRALVEYWADIYRALLAVPIIVKDEIYGGIVLYFPQPRAFSDDQVDLAMAFANQAALAIENSRLRDQVQRTAATAERNRLARDLHDAVTQTLFSASLIAEAIPRVWERNPAEATRGLEELRHLTRGASAEMRTMLLELRPAALTEKPIGELLRHLVEAVTGRTRIPVTLTMEGAGSLPPQIQIAYFRIAQEALNNVAKHSGASQAAVELRFEAGQVALRVRDDGCGFDLGDTRTDQLGLDIMRERAESIGAVLEIHSQPGAGTQVAVNWRGAQGRGSDG